MPGYPFDANPYGAPGPRWPLNPPEYYMDDNADEQADEYEADEDSLFAHDPDRYLPESQVGVPRHELQSPHYDDYGPEENDWEHQRAHEASTPVGGILRQSEQWPDRCAANRHQAWGEGPQHDKTEGNALDPEHHEFFRNHDPALGTTAPTMLHGEEPKGAVPIQPPEDAQPGDAVVLHPDVTGLEYPVVGRWNDEHGSWDVLRPLG